MTFLQLIMLYFCTVVCTLYLVSGGYKVIRNYIRKKTDAAAAEKILPLLSEKESAVYRRGRNAKVNSVPHHASINQYHAATGVEALFGWLYLQGQTERITELFAAIMEVERNAT